MTFGNPVRTVNVKQNKFKKNFSENDKLLSPFVFEAGRGCYVKNTNLVIDRTKQQKYRTWQHSAATTRLQKCGRSRGYKEMTHVCEVMGSNPSAVYWMDIFSH